jgi:hypothetical protein
VSISIPIFYKGIKEVNHYKGLEPHLAYGNHSVYVSNFHSLHHYLLTLLSSLPLPSSQTQAAGRSRLMALFFFVKEFHIEQYCLFLSIPPYSYFIGKFGRENLSFLIYLHSDSLCFGSLSLPKPGTSKYD